MHFLTYLVAALLAQSARAWSTDPVTSSPFGPLGYVPNATFGPPLELFHEFYGQWPTGIAVSRAGRVFINFPVQTTVNFTVGEIDSPTAEIAFPNASFNTPPSLTNTTNPQYAAGYGNYLISVQSVVIDSKDRLWLLDTGRPLVHSTTLMSSGFGPKLIGIDLTTNQTFQTITFPPSIVYPDSYLNDVRFDLNPNITSSGKGVAYIADSSDEGRNGIVVVDLGTGVSWRHLDRDPSTLADPGFVGTYDGVPLIVVRPMDSPSNPGAYARFTTGADGIALSADGEYLYYTPLASRRFYRIATSLLRVPANAGNPDAAIAAVAGVEFIGQPGSHINGLEASNDGMIWVTAPEQDAITSFNPITRTMAPFVRDPRIQWPDSLSVGADGYLYMNINQYTRQATVNNGTDHRVRPFATFRVPLPNNASKIVLP